MIQNNNNKNLLFILLITSDQGITEINVHRGLLIFFLS